MQTEVACLRDSKKVSVAGAQAVGVGRGQMGSARVRGTGADSGSDGRVDRRRRGWLWASRPEVLVA